MAKSKIPRALDRRHLLQRDTPAAQSLAIAEAYLEDDRPLDAIEFLKKAEATERLQSLLDSGVEAGDAFLVKACASALRIAPDRALWLRVAAAADAAGKSLYADTARRQAGAGEE